MYLKPFCIVCECLMRAEHLIGGDVVNDWTNPHCFFLSIAYTRFASSIVDCCGIPCQEVSHRFSIWVFWINIKLSLSWMRTNERTNKQRSQWKYQSNRLQRSNEFKRIQMKKKTTTLIISKSTVNFVDYSVFVINRSMITIV